MAYGVTYADAEAEYNDADAVIFGVPYDHTASYKAGAREAPTAVRQASYNFEEFHFEHGLDQVQPVVCDYGNCDDFILPEDMIEEVKFAVAPTIRDGKFPIVIGGEHSGTIPVVQSFKKGMNETLPPEPETGQAEQKDVNKEEIQDEQQGN